MIKKPGIRRLIELQELLLKFRSIKRMVRIPPDAKEKENDVEHSYVLAMAAWFLASYFPKINRDKVIRIALVHDLIEAYAGDTSVWAAPEQLAAQKLAEEKAIKQIKQDWPDFQGLTESINEYEAVKSEEAKFVYALDKLMPAIMNYLSKGYVWQKHGITFERLKTEKATKVTISPEINAYYQELLTILEKKPNLFAKNKVKTNV